jgi:hypothetical protein
VIFPYKENFLIKRQFIAIFSFIIFSFLESTDKDRMWGEGSFHWFHPEIFFFLLSIYSFIHMCIHWLGHLSPNFPPHPPLPLHPSLLPTLPSPSPLLPGRSCSALFSNFVKEKT